MQKEDQNSLYVKLPNYIPKSIVTNKNKAKTWEYGYNEKYNVVVISKNGKIGDVISINGLAIGLPEKPKKVYKRSETKAEQYWESFEVPSLLKKIPTIFQWNQTSPNFKNQWVEYIESEFDKRDEGFWFMNNGKPTYITGSHYMYLQWTKIDIGLPDFREANRIFYICSMNYPKTCQMLDVSYINLSFPDLFMDFLFSDFFPFTKACVYI